MEGLAQSERIDAEVRRESVLSCASGSYLILISWREAFQVVCTEVIKCDLETSFGFVQKASTHFIIPSHQANKIEFSARLFSSLYNVPGIDEQMLIKLGISK